MMIGSMRLTESGMRAMARTRGRSPATVSRELARKTIAEGARAGVPAHALSQTRRIPANVAPKLHPAHLLWGTVLTLLEWK